MRMGVIGYGNRIRWMVSQMTAVDPDCRVAAIADPDAERIRAELGEDVAGGIRFFRSADEMLAEMQLDGVAIGTRCSLHTEMALKVFATGLPLFLEKPIATTYEDLGRLRAGYAQSASRVVVSFPLRFTPLLQLAKEIVASGKLGTVEHVQAVNNVPYGGVYYHHWYRDERETGGMFLQKATHDFDYLNALIGQKPVQVGAMTSKQVFRGDKPAGLRCADCEENRTCAESAVRTDVFPEPPQGEFCCFAEDTGNEDSGSALIRYESGMHLTYSHNFFARRGAAARGARLLGYKGTLEFDWYTAQAKVHMHHTDRVETYQLSLGDDGHGGGDRVLARNFVEVMKGIAQPESALETGMLSALLCLKARQSAQTAAFQSIGWNAKVGALM
ncbi:Gfo/Idh/MocA family protein [Cohnella nanjingensis]|uniref:Gfo/Idh/MocA family oxidoreductase n=1 Tax=Cohnella nanjingensis TaxID=1387779 RepID=A0A7X0RMX9_9BACL|nr:Gfo/Idh/MocA family oxidoreductase [Cohnella nanjingensis]MBB6670488.1 Gfo/Idh/MocA family oxidoreductase [Cohnella nanjingensis]